MSLPALDGLDDTHDAWISAAMGKLAELDITGSNEDE